MEAGSEVRASRDVSLTPFRFRWRRRPNWGFEAYDAFEGDFRLAQILYDPGTRVNRPDPYRWILCAFYMRDGRAQPDGRTGTPREAAVAAETAFPLELANVYGFHIPTERAIELCCVLGIDLPPQTRWQAMNRAGFPGGHFV